jgi:hypothetical protein
VLALVVVEQVAQGLTFLELLMEQTEETVLLPLLRVRLFPVLVVEAGVLGVVVA